MNDPRAVLAGSVDWAATWSAMRQALRAAKGPHEPASLGDRWQRRAARFDQRSRENAARDGLPAPLAAELRPDDVVVDIGAGTGRHALLLARHCRRVIAVEPSPAMRARLARRVAEEGLDNVEIVDGAWPMAGGPVGDVVFSSHVLYGVDDAAGFLRAMDAAARRLAALHLGLRAPCGALDPVWERLHGVKLPRRPAALEALNLLHQLGLPASLAIVPGSERPFDFGAGDDDLDDVCHRLSLDPTEANRARLRAVLPELAPLDTRGMHVLGVTGPNAILGWASAHRA